MEDEKEPEETPSRGNDWEVVSLTASAYAAAPGPEAFDRGNESVGEEDDDSRAMFMSGHFVFPPSQHENLPIEPIEPENEVENSIGKGIEVPNQVTETQGKSLPGHDAAFQTDVSGSAVHNENLSIQQSDVSSESNFDSSSDSFKSLSPTKENKSKGSCLPCDAWWKRQAVSLYAQAKEANAFWSVFVAAALMGIVILGQRWQQERWQSLQSNISNEKVIRMMGPLSRFKDIVVGGHRQGSVIRGSASPGR